MSDEAINEEVINEEVSVDDSQAANADALSFELAAKIGYRESCKKATPVLLEPIMKLEVVTPESLLHHQKV